MDRQAAVALPNHCGLALIGDSDRRNFRRFGAGRRQSALDHRDRGPPNFLRIVLDPAIVRKILSEFLLIDGDRLAFPVKQDCAAACGALVDGQDIGLVGHGRYFRLRDCFATNSMSWARSCPGEPAGNKLSAR